MEEIKIQNFKDIAAYKNKLEDKKWLASVSFDISKMQMPTLRIVGSDLHSSLNYNLMQAFCILQDEIYRSFAEYKYGKRNKSCLSEDEKISLEIFVEVKEGSTILTLLLPHLVQPGMNLLANITGNDIFRNEGLIIAASVFVDFLRVSIDKSLEKEKSAEKQSKVKYKKETSKVQFWKLFTRTKTIETIECDGKDITKILKTLSK